MCDNDGPFKIPKAHARPAAIGTAPALHAVHHWRDATWRENQRDGRPRVPYYWYADRRSTSRGERWHIAYTWHARYVHAVHQPPVSPVGIGQQLAAAHGWTGGEWSCLYALWNRESGWDPLKSNYAGSGAYGIPQALPGSKMASAGVDWRTNPRTQIQWGLGYISGRYGSPCGAWAHSESAGWY